MTFSGEGTLCSVSDVAQNQNQAVIQQTQQRFATNRGGVLQFPHISPSLLKSANPWATTKEDLQALCGCPYTGAITTRTSRSSGFKHDPTIHQYAFFDARDHSLEAKDVPDGLVSSEKNGSPNTLGYNPILLHQYLNMTKDISDAIADTASKSEKPLKPVIISVTGDATDVTKCYTLAWTHVRDASIKMPLALEINLSCRNIPDKPPPAYSGKALSAYLHQLNTQMMIFEQDYGRDTLKTATGIKTPPYTYADQFKELIDALLESCKPLVLISSHEGTPHA
ncbi:dihydroorotate dehydrogenase [Elasticomyces elasticus]|nr:dihydroorotate dehydrogenase [Elasticomyces elasticus]